MPADRSAPPAGTGACHTRQAAACRFSRGRRQQDDQVEAQERTELASPTVPRNISAIDRVDALKRALTTLCGKQAGTRDFRAETGPGNHHRIDPQFWAL